MLSSREPQGQCSAIAYRVVPDLVGRQVEFCQDEGPSLAYLKTFVTGLKNKSATSVGRWRLSSNSLTSNWTPLIAMGEGHPATTAAAPTQPAAIVEPRRRYTARMSPGGATYRAMVEREKKDNRWRARRREERARIQIRARIARSFVVYNVPVFTADSPELNEFLNSCFNGPEGTA
eukprot:TRINITY_DN4181_c0_g1_i1.p1 TRINITY_DN4181_c0_g1~~TRINITY_DN4181_c0_g1_i1.p1  ORF type:complete len:176 (-),score=3.11 TRINITY_DN4181_c0_g1_i1:251-778(-)